MRVIVAAVHGILTRQTDPSWPDALEEWLGPRDEEMQVLKRRYWAGPFPRWNNWVKDPREGRIVADMIWQEWKAARSASGDEWPAWLVAHSNGAVIALMAARELIRRRRTEPGPRLAGLILTGAACEADVVKSGVLSWYARELVMSAVSYSSEDDGMVAGDERAAPKFRWRVRDWIWGRLMWPYGSLGRTGWLSNGEPAAYAGLFTRWWEGFGHSGYFEPGNRERVFEQMYEDMASGTAALEKLTCDA